MCKLKSILLVDDDYASNYLTEIILQDMEIAEHIHIVKNGKEALSFVEEYCSYNQDREPSYCPDLILLDINMPVMDGFEFLSEFEKIKDKDNSTLVVLLTTSTNNKDIEKAKKYNVTAYLEKPLTEEKIKKIVEKI